MSRGEDFRPIMSNPQFNPADRDFTEGKIIE